MSKMLLRLTSVIAVATALLTLPGLEVSSQRQTKAPAKLSENEFLVNNIRSVTRVLEAEHFAIEAELLFTLAGRKKLREALSAFPDMSVSKVASEALRGVVMAGSLTLPERSEIGADTVIIAKHITFTGRAPVIEGPHDFHVFGLDSVTLENRPETVITIDTSGVGRLIPRPQPKTLDHDGKPVAVLNASGAGSNNGLDRAPETPEEKKGAADFDGASGPTGTAGEPGTNGKTGQTGSCSAQMDGRIGNSGTDGSKGADGGAGTPGKNATDAGHQTIIFDGIGGALFNLIALGGTGGMGGAGGPGGNGGPGGDGGAGGPGAACTCAAGGTGRGGDGGVPGGSGLGGNGGSGGNGGDGGNGGSIVAAFPNTPKVMPVGAITQGGSGGRGGRAGSAGAGGTAGGPGAGGNGGTVAGCTSNLDGRADAVGVPGTHGRAGQHGAWGKNGASGSLRWGIVGLEGL